MIAVQRGTTMLEVLVAIVIFAVGLVGLLGMQAMVTKTATDAQFRVSASQVAAKRIAKMWVDQSNLASYDSVTINVAELPGGKLTTAVSSTTVTVTVTWIAPGLPRDPNAPDTNPYTGMYVAVAEVTNNS
jgi:type IV pilus assembly protein PilV